MIFLMVIFVEISLRLLLMNDSYLEALSSNHSSFRRLAWIHNHQEDEVRDLSQIHQIDYVLGWKYKANLSSFKYLNDSNAVLSTNSEGYRNSFDFSQSHRDPIFMLGDSFTFGEEVSDKETYTYLLNEKFKDQKFYNLGVNAYGYDQMLLTLKKYIELYKPKTVVVSYNFVDLDRALLSFHDYFKPYYTQNDGKIKLHTDHIYNPKDAIDYEKFNIKFIDLFKILNAKYFLDPKSYREQRSSLNEEIFKEMLSVTKFHGARLIFYYLPIAWEANDLSPDLLPTEKQMFDYCQKLELECYSTRSEFINYNKRSGKRMKETGHWTEEGHKAVFRSMSKVFEK
jgi:hypothetical protein